MYKIIIALSTIALLPQTGCQNQPRSFSLKPSISPEKKAAERDFTINKSNAYNDIFLDSMAVERFIRNEKMTDTMSSAMRDFYNTRNFEYTWFSSTGLIEQCLSFHSMYSSDNNSDLFNKSLENSLDKLRMGEGGAIEEKDPATIKTELQITERFILYSRLNNKNMSPALLAKYIPAKKAAILERVDSVLNNIEYKKYASINASYSQLMEQLQKYRSIEKRGGWKPIVISDKKMTPGQNIPVTISIKKRLQITGELAATDTSGLVDEALENAVKTYQLNHGYKPSGIITGGLVKDLNISVLARLQQLIINMQRRRWMPVDPDGQLIIVNIPAFELYVDSGKKSLFQMDVVVGAAVHRTTMFSGNVSQVVFSPYWNIPPSIVKKEVVPGLRRDKNYLKKRDMEITGSEGGLPVVRQLPGTKNALGKVKFLFPNSFNIYMHDTPEKDFFNRSVRGLSHGCIRLSNPVKMANYLLQDSKTWTPLKIDSAMNSGREKFVKLKEPVPVIITYYTSWVDEKGTLHFADDIYGHDKQMAEKMFTNPQ